MADHERIRDIDTEIGRLRFWGSECCACGNTTPAVMRCDSCGRTKYTTALWIDDDAVAKLWAMAEADEAT